MTAHNVRLTEMRISDHVVTLKSVSKAYNPILERRDNMSKHRYCLIDHIYKSIYTFLIIFVAKAPFNSPKL